MVAWIFMWHEKHKTIHQIFVCLIYSAFIYWNSYTMIPCAIFTYSIPLYTKQTHMLSTVQCAMLSECSVYRSSISLEMYLLWYKQIESLDSDNHHTNCMIYPNRTFQLNNTIYFFYFHFSYSVSNIKSKFISHFPLQYQFNLQFLQLLNHLRKIPVFPGCSLFNRCVVTVVTMFVHRSYTYFTHSYSMSTPKIQKLFENEANAFLLLQCTVSLTRVVPRSLSPTLNSISSIQMQ